MKRILISFLLLGATAAHADQWESEVREQLRLGNKVTRACSEHTGTCTLAIRAGDYMLVEVEDAHGKTAARLVCQFNTFRDRRTCLDFDTKEKRIEVFAKGKWVTAR